MELSTTSCLTSGQLKLALNLLFARATWTVAIWQKTSFFCTQICLTIVGGSYVSLSVLGTVLFVIGTQCSFLGEGASERFGFKTWSMAYSRSLFSSGLSSLLVVESCNSAPAAWCFIPVQWMRSRSKSDKGRHHRESHPIASARLSIHLSAM